MAMSTSSAALTTAQRKLKNLAVDAISVTSTEELYTRKVTELADAKRKLAALVSKQIAVEGGRNRKHGDTDSIVKEKAAAEAQIARLEHEGGLLKAQIIEQRPKPPLSPAQQVWADAFDAAARFDPYHRVKRGTPSQIEAAREAVDELVREYRLQQPSGNARDAWSAKYNAARTRLAALEGPPYPPYRPWASDETLKAARQKEGLE